MARRLTTRLDDFPIPEDVKADPKWPPIMLDMAAHVGAHATLLIVDTYAGQEVYVPLDVTRSPFRDIVDEQRVATMAHVFGRQRIRIPAGRLQLDKARRAGIVAAIRADKMTISEGAAIIRMPRRHMETLIKKTDEATDAEPVAMLVRPRDTRQLEMFGEE